jgi:multisubunit Na+/H+ antiporter MnhE subunit
MVMLQLILNVIWNILTTWNIIDSVVVGFAIAAIVGVSIGRLLQKRIWRLYEYK